MNMKWTVEYYEQADGVQPAEVFEDQLDLDHPRLAAKLAHIAEEMERYGSQLGGGYIEPCRGYGGLWELRAIYGQWLGRELFGFDGERIVLLYGYVKRAGQPASTPELDKAFAYWKDYQRTRRVSPETEEDEG